MVQGVESVSPIPSTVDVARDHKKVSPSPTKSKFGSNLRSQFSAPLGLFAGHSRLFADDADTDSTSGHTERSNTKRLGISRPPRSANDDDSTKASTTSHRIGILRSNYDVPDLPLSPLNAYSQKSKIASPTPNLVRSDDSESDGDNLWQLKISSQRDNYVPDLKPQQEEEHKADEVDRFLHIQTAQGHYLVNSQPLDSPMQGIKYCLTNGTKSMSSVEKKTVNSSNTIKTRPNIVSAPSTSTPAPVARDEAFKVFLLLIQPKSKIFEIIQVFYSPRHTTVRNILEMIPLNATEPALGSQEYSSLCRPKDGKPIDIDVMASSKSGDNKECARIVKGELLVAIPNGYSGSLCARISTPILSNPKVRKLLERSDPLAPKRKKKRSSRRTIEIEKIIEESESVGTAPGLARAYDEALRHQQATNLSKGDELLRQKERHSVRKALQSAAIEAASTNAQVDTDLSSIDDGSASSAVDIPVEMWKTPMSLKSQYTRSDSIGGSSIESTDCSNTRCSKSVTSASTSDTYGSLDAEFLDSLKRMPRKAPRPRRHVRRQHRKKLIRNMVLVLGAMLLRYIMVRYQQGGAALSTFNSNVANNFYTIGFDDKFGFWGMIQVGVTLMALAKLQQVYLKGQGGDISFYSQIHQLLLRRGRNDKRD
jgi:hypothetical protein